MTRACIIVASHISKSYRLKYLCESLQSLIEQTVIVPIFLSISFDNELVLNVYHKIMEKNGLSNNANITIYERNTKTSQFRHIFNVFESIKSDNDYIMFCDDDDSYVNNRVELFINAIEGSLLVMDKQKKFVGVYERKNKKSHSDEYKEYWSYCISSIYMQEFFTKINKGSFDKFIDYDIFDVLFASYIRFMDSSHVFVSYQLKLYNYRKNTRDSITANMINKSNKIDTASTFNEFIHNNIIGIKHNILLKNAMGRNYDIDCVLKDAFCKDFLCPNLIMSISPDMVNEINTYYHEIRHLVTYMNIYQK